eukprot:ANDGO_07604.mRNA.1 DNA-(apurinic or apyrimidinic site) lyase
MGRFRKVESAASESLVSTPTRKRRPSSRNNSDIGEVQPAAEASAVTAASTIVATVEKSTDSDQTTHIVHESSSATTVMASNVFRTYAKPAILSAAKFTSFDPNLHLKIMSWNVNGIRAVLRKEASFVKNLCDRQQPDVLFLQETKISEEAMREEVNLIANCNGESYETAFHCCTEKKGYAGTAVLCKRDLLILSKTTGFPQVVNTQLENAAVPQVQDTQGRFMTVELEHLYVCGAYVPNSGDGLKNLEYRTKVWEPCVAAYLKRLDAKKPVVYVGDLNCAHEAIDLHAPKTNQRSAGFTTEERHAFSRLLQQNSLVDTFRHIHGPEHQEFSYFGARFNGRASGKGWRLDYCLVSERLVPAVDASYILPEVPLSDHVPVAVILNRQKLSEIAGKHR